MKHAVARLVALVLSVTLLMAISVNALSPHANTPSESYTTYEINVPLTSVDTNSSTSMVPFSTGRPSTLNASLSMLNDGTCTLVGTMSFNGKPYSINAEGTEFYEDDSNNLGLYMLSGYADNELFTAALNYDFSTNDVSIFATLGEFTDSTVPIQLEFGTFTYNHQLLNTNAINAKKSDSTTASRSNLNASLHTTTASSVDANYQDTTYYTSNSAAIVLFAPLEAEQGHNFLVYAKISADANKIFQLASALDDNVTSVSFNKAIVSIESSTVDCPSTSHYPASSTDSFNVIIPIYTGDLTSLTNLIDPRNYSFNSYEFIISKVTTSDDENYVNGTFQGTAYKTPNIFWGTNGTPVQTQNAISLRGTFSCVSSATSSVSFTATSNLTMAYTADLGGAHEVYKTLPLGNRTANATVDII